MKDFIKIVQAKKNLSMDEMESLMHQVMAGEASPEEFSEFLLALREKGATVEEITGAAKIMRRFVVRIPVHHEIILDTCGTGGDKSHTFNISTITAFVLAGGGVSVAKHGNRSVSSRCGSADVLESLGVNIQMKSELLAQCLDEVGIAFLFAQKLHPAMKHAAGVRKQLGVETIFNVLGPLTNPAMATHQMMGVYSRDLVEPMAQVLMNLGLKRALVVHGSDGLDEATTTGETFISEMRDHKISSYSITPEELKILRATSEDLKGGDINKNCEIALNVLKGQEGPQRDIVILNAACAFYVSEKADTIGQGLEMAGQSIDSGEAFKKLQKLKDFSHGCT